MPWWIQLAFDIGLVTGVLGLGSLWWSVQKELREVRQVMEREKVHESSSYQRPPL